MAVKSYKTFTLHGTKAGESPEQYKIYMDGVSFSLAEILGDDVTTKKTSMFGNLQINDWDVDGSLTINTDE